MMLIEATRQGMEVLKEKRVSNLISITLCKKDNPYFDEYVTHIYNHEFNGFSNGHYYRDYDNALQDFNERN